MVGHTKSEGVNRTRLDPVAAAIQHAVQGLEDVKVAPLAGWKAHDPIHPSTAIRAPNATKLGEGICNFAISPASQAPRPRLANLGELHRPERVGPKFLRDQEIAATPVDSKHRHRALNFATPVGECHGKCSLR